MARKHGLLPSLLFRWRHLREQGAMTGLKADEELVPASEMKAARAKIRCSVCSARRPRRTRSSRRRWRSLATENGFRGCRVATGGEGDGSHTDLPCGDRCGRVGKIPVLGQESVDAVAGGRADAAKHVGP